MTHNLCEFVPHFALYLNVEKVQNPAQEHFEKTNIQEQMGYMSNRDNKRYIWSVVLGCFVILGKTKLACM